MEDAADAEREIAEARALEAGIAEDRSCTFEPRGGMGEQAAENALEGKEGPTCNAGRDVPDGSSRAEREPHRYPRLPYGYVPDDYLPAEAMEEREPKRRGYHNQEIGKRGEDAAARLLEHRGFRILERNWRCYAGEADIIAEFEGECREVHFVEVKTRTSTCAGFPEDAVDAEKRGRYERIMEMYMREHDVGEALIIFDVISILVTMPNRALVRMRSNIMCGE